jgi:hypothetical protein
VSRGVRLALAALLATASAHAGAPSPKAVPVMVGGNADIDACPSLAQVGGATSGLISVKAGPSAEHAEIDRLANGAFAYACEEHGEWTGVVYLQGKNEAPDCGVASNRAKRSSYKGPCKSGWVRSRWLSIVAG